MRKRRTHGPTLITMAEREIRDGALIPRGTRVLVGVSGGPDSMALMHVLSGLRGKLGFEVLAQAVVHGLRAEAEGEVELAGREAERMGVELQVTRLKVPPGGNLQARARKARLAALREAAGDRGAERIALAHHADDRAETVMMRILRGTGPAGLAVMPARAKDLIRPLIRARRNDVLSHLHRHGIPFAIDPSNQDSRFMRVRVRSEIMPLLESISPAVVEHLCALADDVDALSLPRAPYGRSQLRALAQAAGGGKRGVRVSLPSGQVARVDVSTGRIVIEPANGTKGARKPRHGTDDA